MTTKPIDGNRFDPSSLTAAPDDPVAGSHPALPPPPEAIMRDLFALMEQFASDVRHAGESLELVDETRQRRAEDDAVQALRDKADNAFASGFVAAVCDIGSAGTHLVGAGASDAGRERAKAGASLCDAAGKASAGVFQHQGLTDDLSHEHAQNAAQHARDLAKHAADMVGDGRTMSQGALDQRKQCFDQALQARMNIHYV